MKPARFLVVAALLAGAAPASAYVRSRTTHGTPTRWAARCALVQPDAAGTPDLDKTLTFDAIKRSLAVWREATKSCAYMTLDYVAPETQEARYDGTNAIKFRTDKWCHPADTQTPETCYSAVAAGITTVFYIDRPGADSDGRILDADIELNDINFTFDIIDPVLGPTRQPRTGTDLADLENTLVHELGHLQGLDHTCKDAATPANEVDENGNPPTDCTKVSTLADPKRITEATMYNSAGGMETKKRSPEADDIAGICNAYPTAQDPGTCEPADLGGAGGKGCAIEGRGSRAWPLAILALGLALFARRRRHA